MESYTKDNMKDALLTFLDYYLIKRDEKKALEFVSDGVISLGTGVQEIAVNKQQLRELMLAEFEEHPDAINFDVAEYSENATTDITRNCFCKVDAKIEDENGIVTKFSTRLTASSVWIEDRWIICTLHMSSATFFQAEDEFFPLKYGFDTRGKINSEVKKEAIELMMDMIPGGIMGGYLEEGFPLYIINDELLGYMGYTYDELIEETGGMMIKTMHPEDAEYVQKTVDEELAKNGVYDIMYRLKRKDGSYFWIRDKGRRIKTEDGRDAMVSVMMDISENVELQKRLEERATKDSLTNIYNRAAAIQLIEEFINKGGKGTLCIIDIDRFKHINDTYRHQVGDKILITLAEILKAGVGDKDIVARLGGDEFIVYFKGITDEAIITEKVDKMRAKYREGAKKIKEELECSFSTGGYIHQDKASFSELYHYADEMLYESKRMGRDDIRIKSR